MPVRAQFRDLLISVALALLVVSFIVYFGFHPPGYGVSLKWIELCVVTIALFWTLVQSFWSHRKSPKLWIALCALLAVHSVVFVLVFAHSGWWHLPATVLVFSAEAMLLALVVNLFTGFVPRLGKR
jgi:hypothetical protein